MKRVRFEGEDYWWLDPDEASSPLAPIQHFAANGEMLVFGLSFAHICGKRIMRFGKQIGTVADLEDVVA